MSLFVGLFLKRFCHGLDNFANSIKKKDLEYEALHWTNIAMESGSPVAAMLKARFHLEGLAGLPRSRGDAVKYLRRAAEGGVVDAKIHLAMFGLKGK